MPKFLKDTDPSLPTHSHEIRVSRRDEYLMETQSIILSKDEKLTPISQHNGKFSAIFKDDQWAYKTALKSGARKISSIRQLLFEITLLQKLNHPNIIESEPQAHILKIKYCSNGSLFNAITSTTRSKTDNFNHHKHSIIQGIASGVDYLHQQGIVHRDIKAENCLLDDEMQPHIIDFGFSVCLYQDPAENQALNIKGTPDYLAPELQTATASGHCMAKVNFKQDIFALGILFLEIVWKQCIDQIINPKYSSHHPQEKSKAIQKEQFLVFTRSADGHTLHETICDIITRLCAFNPEKRPDSQAIVRHTKHLTPAYCSFFNPKGPDTTPQTDTTPKHAT